MEEKKKLITIPSVESAGYDCMSKYVDAYINAVEDVLHGSVDGVENPEADEIDYDFIFEKIKNTGKRYFPEDYNNWPCELTSQRDLVGLYDRIIDSYSDAVAEPRLRIKCKDCGEEFFLYNNDVRFYHEHGYAIPKRCKKCRKARRDARETAQTDSVEN